MSTVADPVGSGLIQSLARPGANITGLSMAFDEVAIKNLELLKEVAPRSTRLALITDPDTEFHRRALPGYTAAAQRLGMQLQPFAVRKPEEFDTAFAAISDWHADALTAFSTSLVNDPASRRRILAYAARERLPTIFGPRYFAVEGALLAHGINYPALHRRSAYYVDRILRGAKPADLPVEQPVAFNLVVNSMTAKALGLTIPPTILARADEVIE